MQASQTPASAEVASVQNLAVKGDQRDRNWSIQPQHSRFSLSHEGSANTGATEVLDRQLAKHFPPQHASQRVDHWVSSELIPDHANPSANEFIMNDWEYQKSHNPSAQPSKITGAKQVDVKSGAQNTGVNVANKKHQMFLPIEPSDTGGSYIINMEDLVYDRSNVNVGSINSNKNSLSNVAKNDVSTENSKVATNVRFQKSSVPLKPGTSLDITKFIQVFINFI